MKKYNWLMIMAVLVYVSFATLLWYGSRIQQNKESMAYKVEIHEVMQQLEQEAQAAAIDMSAIDMSTIDMSTYQYLQKIYYLPKENEVQMAGFFDGENGVHSCIKPLMTGEEITGYVRFDYILGNTNQTVIRIAEEILFVIFVLVMALLLFVRVHILKPFHAIREMPYELSRGHLQVDLEENKNRFFGKFIWGLSMLRDSLSDAKAKELKLLKEKKMLLLSVSHDIKIPLSAIKLYAKAIKEDIYDTPEKRHEAALQIEVHAKEIENFVKEIVNASSEEIMTIEVENTDFYLKDFVEKIKETYLPKAQVTLTELEIGAYENKLLKGDMDRTFEVMENLLENAFKYGDGKRIAIDFYEEDYCQVVRVFNTGTVVPITEMPHLFDSFYRGSNAADKPGNGLGLYISRQIMNKMEGEIFAERKEDGMSFCLVFCVS